MPLRSARRTAACLPSRGAPWPRCWPSARPDLGSTTSGGCSRRRSRTHAVDAVRDDGHTGRPRRDRTAAWSHPACPRRIFDAGAVCSGKDAASRSPLRPAGDDQAATSGGPPRSSVTCGVAAQRRMAHGTTSGSSMRCTPGSPISSAGHPWSRPTVGSPAPPAGGDDRGALVAATDRRRQTGASDRYRGTLEGVVAATASLRTRCSSLALSAEGAPVADDALPAVSIEGCWRIRQP